MHTFSKHERPHDLRTTLAPHLTPPELRTLKTALDVIGDIAIIEIDHTLKPQARLIAQTLLTTNTSIHTVLQKAGRHAGRYRIQHYTYLAGKRTKETIHKENGVRMKLHLEKTYFSPRLSTERLRIARCVNKGENVLVMFSGIGVYPLVLARNSPAHHITGIELNKDAHRYALQNIQLNTLMNITLYCGDVKKIVPTLHTLYNRIIMPLPHGAANYLAHARACSKKGTVIHYYQFLKEDEVATAQAMIRNTFKKIKFLRAVKCGQTKPRTWRYCIDFQILA